MKNLSIRPKLFILLLGGLLIAGAVAAAISSDAVQRLTANPVLAQPADDPVEQELAVPQPDVLAPASGPTGPGLLDEGAVEDPYLPYDYEDGCGHDTYMNPEDL